MKGQPKLKPKSVIRQKVSSNLPPLVTKLEYGLTPEHVVLRLNGLKEIRIRISDFKHIMSKVNEQENQHNTPEQEQA